VISPSPAHIPAVISSTPVVSDAHLRHEAAISIAVQPEGSSQSVIDAASTTPAETDPASASASRPSSPELAGLQPVVERCLKIAVEAGVISSAVPTLAHLRTILETAGLSVSDMSDKAELAAALEAGCVVVKDRLLEIKFSKL
jgi:hypothetical protein